MPIVGQGGTVTLTADVRNGSGAPADPYSISLSILAPNGDAVEGPITTPTIQRDDLGVFSYAWSVPALLPKATYTATWTAEINGVLVTAAEPVEVVDGGVISFGLMFMHDPDDLEGVQALLGVTDLDLTSEALKIAPFAPQAELRVKLRVPNWSAQVGDPQGDYMLRLACMYATAAQVAESYAGGGMVGNVRPPDDKRDWPKTASFLWTRFEEWCGRAMEAMPDVGQPAELYDLTMLAMSGPSRARFRLQGILRFNWWRYPPVVGVPPTWPNVEYLPPIEIAPFGY